jgi:putative DNA primase/helicase
MNAPTPHKALSEAEVCAQFADAIRAAGLPPPDTIHADGAIHRFATSGKAKDDAGWYILFADGVASGRFGCNRAGMDSTWSSQTRESLTPAERQAQKERMAQARAARDAAEKDRHDTAAKRAALIWERATVCADGGYPYLQTKGVNPCDARVIDASAAREVAPDLSRSLGDIGPLLVVPMRNTAGKLRSLQFITADGVKRPLTGGEKRGCYFAMGKPKESPDGPVLIVCEGFATGASIHESTGHAVAVAFDRGGLLPVGQALRKKYTGAVLVFAADDDHTTDGNPGLTDAKAAAMAVGGLTAWPLFGPDRDRKATDFNDLHQVQGGAAGLAAVRACFAGVIPGLFPDVMDVQDATKQAESLMQQQAYTHSVASCPQSCPQDEAATPTNTLILSGEDLTGLHELAADFRGADDLSGVEYSAPVDHHPVNQVDHHQDGAEPDDRHQLPGMDERPCFQVLDDWTDTNGGKLAPGVWFFGVKEGKGDAPPSLTQNHVCTPIHIDAITQDANTSNVGLLLRFKTDFGKMKTWAMPREMLAGDCADIRAYLLREGARINHNQDHLLARYLKQPPPKRRMQCATQTGWAGAPNDKRRAFVLPDTVIGPGHAGIVYQHEARGSDEYTTTGTLEGWKTEIAALAVGNPILTLAICTAFAGPVLGRLNAQGGGLHLVGDSSTGKTSAVDAACSVWGGQHFRRSWRATGNGMEGVAALFNDCLLALDEISECDPKEVGAIVYSLGNGVGKQRAGRTGLARAVVRWRCSVLSSGERTIETTMRDGGHKIKAGQSVRLLDVPAHRTHGAWDELHTHTTGAAMSGAIRNAAQVQHGTAGRAFLEALTADDDDMSETMEVIKALPELQPGTNEGQAVRAAERFALLALAGELATSYGVTGWERGEAIKAASAGLTAWQRLRGDRPKGTTTERGQVLDAVKAFIERHGSSRFSNADEAINQAAPPTVRDRAGWFRDSHDGRRYLFHATGMRDALAAFDFRRATEELKAVGAWETPASGKAQKLVSIQGEKVRVYVINPAHLDQDEADTNEATHGSQ